MENSIQQNAHQWLSDNFDEETRNEVQKLMEDSALLEDCFYKDLEFGTGGMRGIMGVGTNRINKYTLGKATQGLSNFLLSQYPSEKVKVVIAFDCRNNSDTLARVVADVLSANGIYVYLFEDLRTTPELSFAVKHLNCHAGVVLTASHNPPEYNGYKVYYTDGGQIVPPQDKQIISTINNIDFSEINFDGNDGLIKYIGAEIDRIFIEKSIAKGSFCKIGRDDLKVVFTSLHGTSITAVPQVLTGAGYNNVYIVEEQATPNGNFPTVISPNPEEPEALALAIKKANEVDADILIGTDPDCDRLGIGVKDLDGNIILLNGNQTMVMMTDFLLSEYQKKGLVGNEFIASTIVSTPMMQKLADHYNVELKTSLTGFKWIAKMIKDFPEMTFIGGGEESYGFMVGDFVRDKDAVTSSLLACEIATLAKSNGSSFYEGLITLYKKHGLYKEKLVSMVKKGSKGAAEIKQILKDMRSSPMEKIGPSKVVQIDDYLSSESLNVASHKISKIDLPQSNVLIYTTEDGSRIAARPSGTEPKIKFYISVNNQWEEHQPLDIQMSNLDSKIDSILKSLGI